MCGSCSRNYLENLGRGERPYQGCPECEEPFSSRGGKMIRHGKNYACPGVGRKPIWLLWTDEGYKRAKMHSYVSKKWHLEEETCYLCDGSIVAQ